MSRQFAGVLLLTALLLSACSFQKAGPAAPAPTATPSGHTITGQITLGIDGSVKSSNAADGECRGMSGYDDIATGLNVVLKDGDGHVIGVSELGPGVISYREPGYDDLINCRWTFTIASVPDAPFYTLSMGRRGAPTYSHDELAAAGWTVKLTLGF